MLSAKLLEAEQLAPKLREVEEVRIVSIFYNSH